MAAAWVVGAGIILMVVLIGHCSAFGGTCPAEPVSLADDDTFRLAAMGGLVALVPSALLAPRLRGHRLVAVGAALVGAVLVGFVARTAVLG
jgi:hypothetical protein